MPAVPPPTLVTLAGEPAIPKNLYIYLNEPRFVKAWVEGGKIPISLASKYLGDRSGTKTPDELAVVQTIGVTGEHEHLLASVAEEFGISKLWLSDGVKVLTDDGEFSFDNGWIESREQDAMILCLTRSLSRNIAEKFATEWDGKIITKKAVVRILDIERLASVISDQLSTPAQIGWVHYTNSPQRHSFLKSIKDSWQEEIRLAWFTDDVGDRMIDLPAGIAEEVYFEAIPQMDKPPLEDLLEPYDLQIERLDILTKRGPEALLVFDIARSSANDN